MSRAHPWKGRAGFGVRMSDYKVRCLSEPKKYSLLWEPFLGPTWERRGDKKQGWIIEVDLRPARRPAYYNGGHVIVQFKKGIQPKRYGLSEFLRKFDPVVRASVWERIGVE